MSYNVGQFRRGTERFSANMAYSLTNVQDDKFMVNFIYPCIKTTATTMSDNSSYYLRFSVKQIAGSEQTFSLIIKHDGDNETAQTLQTYIVPAGNKESYFELAFSPLAGEYNQIYFELHRTATDFQTTNSDGTIGRKMTVRVQDFYRVLNILDIIQIPKVTKLGIQAGPGQLFVIDGEQIRIGRTGMYELYHDNISISFIGAIVKENHTIPDGKDFFIIDYKY